MIPTTSNAMIVVVEKHDRVTETCGRRRGVGLGPAAPKGEGTAIRRHDSRSSQSLCWFPLARSESFSRRDRTPRPAGRSSRTCPAKHRLGRARRILQELPWRERALNGLLHRGDLGDLNQAIEGVGDLLSGLSQRYDLDHWRHGAPKNREIDALCPAPGDENDITKSLRRGEGRVGVGRLRVVDVRSLPRSRATTSIRWARG